MGGLQSAFTSASCAASQVIGAVVGIGEAIGDLFTPTSTPTPYPEPGKQTYDECVAAAEAKFIAILCAAIIIPLALVTGCIVFFCCTKKGKSLVKKGKDVALKKAIPV